MTTTKDLVLFAILLLAVVFFFRYSLSLNRKPGFRLVLYISIFFLISFFGSFLRIFLVSHLGPCLNGVLPFVILTVGSAGQPFPLPAPSGPSSSASFEEDSFGIDVLLESWSKSTEGGTSVNQPESGRVPPATPVAPRGDEAGPSNQPPPVVPYPYQPDEVIGGDSVDSIKRRLLSNCSFPSAEVIEQARIAAEDLFEVKVDIIRQMTPLDPEGDWMGRGARALDNPRTATGEESLGTLYEKLEDLNRGGVRSKTFWELKGRVFLREIDPPEHSST